MLTCGGTSSQGLAGRTSVDGKNGHLVLSEGVQIGQLHAVLRPHNHLKDSLKIRIWISKDCFPTTK